MKLTIKRVRFMMGVGLLGFVVGCPMVDLGNGDGSDTAAILNIDLASPGHWHVSRAKTLTFSVTDENGDPVTGLQPTIVVKTLAGSEDSIEATDNGDGSYSVDHTAADIGGGYAMAYSVSFSAEHEGTIYSDAWPVEVVRDGNEGIMPMIDGTLYAYQVRYGWNPGTVHASDDQPVTMYFEPRRAVEEGDAINTELPFRNTFNHIPELTATVLIESLDGGVSETLNATYHGLGVYSAERVFSEAEVGSGRDYAVSFLFTDPYNGFALDQSETAYALAALPPVQTIVFDPGTPESVLASGQLLFETTCGACHALPTEEQINSYSSDDAMVFVAVGMAVEAAGVSEEEAEEIARYLLAVRHGV